MIRIVTRAPIDSAARLVADELAQRLTRQCQAVSPGVRILGPAQAPMAKLRGSFRYQIQLQSNDSELLRDCVRQATAGLKPSEGAGWIVDVDPLDMM
jgi:primosomal protein N' (replication factor Y)